MIGKIILIGIVIVTIAILATSSSKLFQSVPALKTVEERIDHATSDKNIVNDTKNSLREVSMGGRLVDTNSTNSATGNSTNTPSSVYQLAPQYVTQQNFTGQVFDKTGNTCEISVPAMAQSVNGQTELTHIIQLGQCSLNIGDPVQVTTLTAKPNAPLVTPSTGLQVTPYSRNDGTSLPTLPSYYNVVTLNTINQGNNAMLNFDDTSGQTKSVTVTVRNSDKTLFTGTFYSSKFTTEIKDVPNTPHIIEMTIDNAVYGVLHASAYAPSNVQNSTITGILSQ